MNSVMTFEMDTRSRFTGFACTIMVLLQCSLSYGNTSCLQCNDATQQTFLNGQIQTKNLYNISLPSNPSCAANTQPASPCRPGVVLCERITVTVSSSEKNRTTNATHETKISYTAHKCSANMSISLSPQCQPIDGNVTLLAPLMDGQMDMMMYNSILQSMTNTTVSGKVCYSASLGGNFNSTGQAIVPLGHVILFMSPLWVVSTLW
ncbi:uncharacterized protein LOC127844812 [Dreissena polymorpha]|uniref:Uncharacterized protein n=1 Tax=Dreissena polymorpha TaxID=45954 RepID=A0A9D4EGQ3_DREPO|nr:uncharacterized protein LOC127844812 [Dreissena polymorpha]KAH3778993.1 hypothetical protein DPMN_180472 [Dreissena polymorpha]